MSLYRTTSAKKQFDNLYNIYLSQKPLGNLFAVAWLYMLELNAKHS